MLILQFDGGKLCRTRFRTNIKNGKELRRAKGPTRREYVETHIKLQCFSLKIIIYSTMNTNGDYINLY